MSKVKLNSLRDYVHVMFLQYIVILVQLNKFALLHGNVCKEVNIDCIIWQRLQFWRPLGDKEVLLNSHTLPKMIFRQT